MAVASPAQIFEAATAVPAVVSLPYCNFRPAPIPGMICLLYVTGEIVLTPFTVN